MNALLSTFQANMNNAINEYASQIATKFNINQDELVQLWNNMNDSPVKGLKKPKKVKKKSKGKKKKSGFILYSMENRDKLKAENPEMKFTDISKLLGKNWKSLTDEEKEVFNKRAREEEPSDDISMQSITTLRKMCKEKGYSNYSQLKKQDLVDILTGKKDPPTRKKRSKSPKKKDEVVEKPALRRKVKEEVVDNKVDEDEVVVEESEEDEEVLEEED
tara:strand:- start:1293 stop:1946 length:654 start_codon:yes stop_codon:yes gene_type:complete